MPSMKTGIYCLTALEIGALTALFLAILTIIRPLFARKVMPSASRTA